MSRRESLEEEMKELPVPVKVASDEDDRTAEPSPAHTTSPTNRHREADGEAGTQQRGNSFQDIKESLKDVITGSKLNYLLVFTPLAFLSAAGSWSDGSTFLFSFLALVPLAAMLGDFTEDLAKQSNDAIGALINVTFGNATELIISIMALKDGMFTVIKNSLIGSVFGNMLLVMGCSFFVGGLKNKELTFNTDSINTYMPMLVLSTVGYLLPSFHETVDPNATEHEMLQTSREISILMVGSYVAYIYFQLVTHKHIFANATIEDGEDDDEDGPQYSWWFGIAGLGICAVFISFLSDFLVGSLEGTAKTWHISEHFIGVILVPIVGNAAEHATAVVMAAKNKMDISIGVALGSSIQVGMFLMPTLVLIGWISGQPLDCKYSPMSMVGLLSTVLLTQSVAGDSKANWLEGMKLLVAYVMLAIAYANAP